MNERDDAVMKVNAMLPAPRLKLLILQLAVLWLAGCTIGPPAQPDDPAWAPIIPVTQPIEPAYAGAIYQEATAVSLFEDRRAHRVGDILIVVLSEKTSTNKKAETDVKKDNEIVFNQGMLLGNTPSQGDNSFETNLNQEREFESEAESAQSNNLMGTIAVTVSAILPNGLMEVRGEKWMTLNNGEEFIRVRGLVRPHDVAPDNTILSTRLADSRITYSGTGDFANSNKQGWLSRFFNTEYWPF